MASSTGNRRASRLSGPFATPTNRGSVSSAAGGDFKLEASPPTNTGSPIKRRSVNALKPGAGEGTPSRVARGTPAATPAKVSTPNSARSGAGTATPSSGTAAAASPASSCAASLDPKAVMAQTLYAVGPEAEISPAAAAAAPATPQAQTPSAEDELLQATSEMPSEEGAAAAAAPESSEPIKPSPAAPPAEAPEVDGPTLAQRQVGVVTESLLLLQQQNAVMTSMLQRSAEELSLLKAQNEAMKLQNDALASLQRQSALDLAEVKQQNDALRLTCKELAQLTSSLRTCAAAGLALLVVQMLWKSWDKVRSR